MDPKLLVALALTVAWFLLAASCSDGEGLDSPQAVAAEVTRVMEAGEYRNLLPLIVPKDRDLVLVSLVIAAAFAGEREELERLQEKYELDKRDKKLRMTGNRDEQRKAAATYLAGIDRPALMEDLMRVIAKADQVSLGGELTDLDIKGDTATGKMGGQPVVFLRLGGSWYFTFPDKALG